MSNKTESTEKKTERRELDESETRDKQEWETPKLEDVSEEVMAQPYIRFT